MPPYPILLYISRGQYLPRGRVGRVLTLIFQPTYFIRVTIDPTAFPTVLTEVTICPAGCNALSWLVSRLLCTLGLSAFAMILPTFKRTPMKVFRFFTIIKFIAIYFWTSQGHYWPLLDKLGLTMTNQSGNTSLERQNFTLTFIEHKEISKSFNFSCVSEAFIWISSRNLFRKEYVKLKLLQSLNLFDKQY